MALDLAHRCYGAGPPLVLLHGLFGSARNWRAVAEVLAAAYRVYALDLRNHGESPRAASMAYPELAADVRHTLGRLGVRAPALVGHSMGGKVAMRLALEGSHAGGGPGGLVVVDIAPVAYAAEPQWSGALARLDTGKGLASPGELRALLSALPEPESHFDGRVNLAAVLSNLEALADFPVPAGARYAGPALFVAGGLSPYLRAEHHGAIRRLFPRAEIVRIPGAGHWVHADQRATLTETIREFLERAQR